MRAGNFPRVYRRTSPVTGVRGKRPMGLGGAKRSRSPSDASPGAFCLLCRHGQSRSPPAGGEIPLRETTGAVRRVVAPYRGRKPSHAGGHMGRPYKKKFNPRSRWRSNLPAFSQKRVSTFLGARDFKMLGGSKFRLRQDFCQGQKCLLTRPATEKFPRLWAGGIGF